MNRTNRPGVWNRHLFPTQTTTVLLLCALAVPGARGQSSASPGAERTIRLECTGDTAIFQHKSPNRSAAYDVNFGASEQVPFHGIHYAREVNDSAYYFLADFDVSKARNLRATGGTLHLRLVDSPDAAKLRVVSVSTVSTPWKEGTGTGKAVETDGGGATANWAVFGQRRWAGPQSELIDATFGLGHSLYHTVEVRHERDGWVAIDLPERIARAVTSGGTGGLALFEEKGQTKIAYRLYTRESPHKPYLTIRGVEDAEPPASPKDLRIQPAGDAATLHRGAVTLSMEVAPSTTCLEVACRANQDQPQLLERWRTPWPAAAAGPLSFVIDDLPAGAPVEVTVRAIGPGGAASAPVKVTGRVSPATPMPPALAIDPAANPAGEPKTHDGKLRVWAYADCEAAHPVSGNLLEEVGPEGFAGKPAGTYRQANSAWNGRDGLVTLAAARNEIVAFHLLIEALSPPLRSVAVEAGALAGPGGFAIPAANVQVYRLWYVQDTDWKPELCIPLPAEARFDIPDVENRVPDQRNQSLIVDLWVPARAPAGTYRGLIKIRAAGAAPFEVPVQLEVRPFVLPDVLSFNCELNAYSSAPLTKDYAWFRLAHAHRATLNVLPYSQDGTVKPVYKVPLAGEGSQLRVADWKPYDDYFGPLLDGSAFDGLPRQGVPLASQYLPFCEAWPVPFREHYAFKSTDLQEHFLAAGPIESMMAPSYEAAFGAIVQDYAAHFRAKGWTRTDMQFYLNNKPTNTRGKLGFWCLDEPQHRDDFLAIRYWGRLFKDAITQADAVDVRFVYRGDISRPHLQRDWFDGVMDLECASSVFFSKSRRCREQMERGIRFYNYGSLNPVAQSNLNAEAWPVSVYLLGGDGLLPWDTIGQAANHRRASPTAILVPPPPGTPEGAPVVCSVRLKALRRGQQDVEYLALLARERGYDREQIAALLAGLLNLEGTTAERFLDEAGETTFRNLTADQSARMRAAVAGRIIEPAPASRPAATRPAVGASGPVGCGENPTVVRRLEITRPGVYENYLVEGDYTPGQNLVVIRADGVTLRRCTIRHGDHNGIVVYARNVVIDSCRIYNQLKGTFTDQRDAHGITGAATDLVIRNCEIHHVSGDAVQFAPSRIPWDNVVIENCTMWTGPLPAAAAGFRKGERPGENAVDTKQLATNRRSRMVIRNCLMYGWGDGQITNQAALNLKNHVDVTVENCVLTDNDYCFRLRGPGGNTDRPLGGARVRIADCAIYRSKVGVRMEDAIADLRIAGLAFGEGIGRKYEGQPGPGYENRERAAPPYETAVQSGMAASVP